MVVSPHRVLVIDDSRLSCELWRRVLVQRYAERVAVETYTDPREGVDHLDGSVSLVLLDWEMPGLDGVAVLAAALDRGVDPKRIIILSAHSAEELHEVFDALGCLAVIEKGEPEQQAAFLMILDALVRRAPP